MLPRLRITELLAKVHGWAGFADRFLHLRTGALPEDSVALMTALLADATDLELARMARSSGMFTHSKLLWTAEWHIRDETYQAALACLVEAIHAQPFTAIWGRRRYRLIGWPVLQGRRAWGGARRAQCPLRFRAGRQVLYPRLRPLCALPHQGYRGQCKRGAAHVSTAFFITRLRSLSRNITPTQAA